MKRRVLIVDDSLTLTRRLVGVVNSLPDYEVVGTAADGTEGIKLFDQLRPDLVLLDAVMPVMDGLQALRSIMDIDPQARVVIVSSIGGVPQKVDEALRLGARDVTTKPLDADDLAKILNRVFAQE